LDGAPGSELVTVQVSPGLGRGRRIARPAGAFPDLLDSGGARSDHLPVGTACWHAAEAASFEGAAGLESWLAHPPAQKRRREGDDAELHGHIIYDGGHRGVFLDARSSAWVRDGRRHERSSGQV